jgi:hypothetical protein
MVRRTTSIAQASVYTTCHGTSFVLFETALSRSISVSAEVNRQSEVSRGNFRFPDCAVITVRKDQQFVPRSCRGAGGRNGFNLHPNLFA